MNRAREALTRAVNKAIAEGAPRYINQPPDTFYRERANGRWEYWTYSDGSKVSLSSDWAERQIWRGTARLTEVN